jgi:hypothetical protein
VCTEDSDCCNNTCHEGTCLALGSCTTVGEPCSGVRECCSNACADPGTGTPVCQWLSGCRPIGEVCRDNGDCCSDECVPSDGGLLDRCNDPPGCLDPGEVCFVGASMNCCGGHEFCRPTIAGVYRCFSEEIPDGECLPDLAPCSFSDECCCLLCAPDPTTGALLCCPEGEDCVPDGGVCLSDMDCCSGHCNSDGFCAEDDTPCVELGGTCVTDEDCCSGWCNPETHTCGVFLG